MEQQRLSLFSKMRKAEEVSITKPDPPREEPAPGGFKADMMRPKNYYGKNADAVPDVPLEPKGDVVNDSSSKYSETE